MATVVLGFVVMVAQEEETDGGREGLRGSKHLGGAKAVVDVPTEHHTRRSRNGTPLECPML